MTTEPQAPKLKIPDESEWDIDNLPNRLTLFRMLLIPIIILSLFLCKENVPWLKAYRLQLGYLAGWTFVAASITDFLDGYIARHRKIVTVFGSFLDPVADKFLVISSLILLNDLHRLPVLIGIILVLRELYITSLRLLALERGFKVPVGAFGKWKTAFQMIGIPMLMAYDNPWGIPMITIGNIFIYLASFFSLYSAFEYSVSLFKKLKSKRNQMLKAQH
jgi:CDP-diacylglycerol--glycerol-3-phosphate 3-phosphatidyltransferase